MADLTDRIRFYDRALTRLSRRELLNIAWTLGAAAIARPLISTGLLAQPLFRSYPFPLGVASGDPLPDGVVLWTRLAPEPLDGGGMPMANVEVAWEVAARPGVPRPSCATAPRSHARSSGTASTSRRQGSSQAASTSTVFTAGRRSARSDAPRPRRRKGRPSIVCASRCAAAATTRPATSRPTDGIAAEQFDFVFHTGDYIYEGRADGGKSATVVRQHRGEEIYTVVDYRNRYALYKSDPICAPRTPRRRSS